jgi:hypothetical protein
MREPHGLAMPNSLRSVANPRERGEPQAGACKNSPTAAEPAAERGNTGLWSLGRTGVCAFVAFPPNVLGLLLIFHEWVLFAIRLQK